MNGALGSKISAVKNERRARLAFIASSRMLVGVATGYVSAVFLSIPLPDQLKPLCFIFLLLAGSGWGLFSAARSLGRKGFSMTDEEAARLLAGDDRDLANVLVAGTDLGKWDEGLVRERNADPSLVAESITAAHSAAVESPRPVLGPPVAEDAKKAVLAAVVMVLAAYFGPGGTRVAVLRVIGGYSGKPVTVGNLSVKLNPPAYTGLSPSTEEGGTGDVKAYAGTQVELKGILSEPVDGGLFVGPDRVGIPVEVSEGQVRVRWVVGKSGTYNLQFNLKGIDIPVEFEPRTVTVVPDRAPEVELLQPATDMEVMNVGEIKLSFFLAHPVPHQPATDDIQSMCASGFQIVYPVFLFRSRGPVKLSSYWKHIV